MYIYVWALLFARLPGWKVCVLRWHGVCLSVMRVPAHIRKHPAPLD